MGERWAEGRGWAGGQQDLGDQGGEELVGVPRGRQRSPWVRLDVGVPGHYRHGQLGLEDPQGGEAGRGGGLAPGSSLLCCRHLSDDKKIKKEEKVWS